MCSFSWVKIAFLSFSPTAYLTCTTDRCTMNAMFCMVLLCILYRHQSVEKVQKWTRLELLLLFSPCGIWSSGPSVWWLARMTKVNAFSLFLHLQRQSCDAKREWELNLFHPPLLSINVLFPSFHSFLTCFLLSGKLNKILDQWTLSHFKLDIIFWVVHILLVAGGRGPVAFRFMLRWHLRV